MVTKKNNKFIGSRSVKIRSRLHCNQTDINSSLFVFTIRSKVWYSMTRLQTDMKLRLTAQTLLCLPIILQKFCIPLYSSGDRAMQSNDLVKLFRSWCDKMQKRHFATTFSHSWFSVCGLYGLKIGDGVQHWRLILVAYCTVIYSQHLHQMLR